MTGSRVPRRRRPRRDVEGRKHIQRIYWISFAVRAVFGVSGYVATEYLGLALLQDALYYEEVGHGIATDWWAGRSSEWLAMVDYGGPVAWLMAGSVGAIYYVIGFRSIILLLVVYSAITAVVPVYIYRIGRQLGAAPVVARRGAWLVALSPAFVFWSGALYKEGLVLLTLSIASYHALRLQAGWSLRSVVVVSVAVGVLFGLRFYLAPLLGGAVLVALLWGRRGVPGRSSGVPILVRQIALVLLFVGILLAFGVHERVERSLMETEGGVLREIEVNRRDLATRAASGYLPDADVSTVEEAARFMPTGLLYFLTVPHPWQLGSFRQNVTIPETAFWMALYPFIALGFWRGFRVNRPGVLFVLLVTGGLCAIYAILSGNIGVAYRMRSQVWLLWAPFAAWGIEAWRERSRRTRVVRPRAEGREERAPVMAH